MKLSERLEQYRRRDGDYGSRPGAPYGCFEMPGPCGERLVIVACDGNVPGELGGWQHVSVSTRRRIPNWVEMSFVKNLFWPPEDCVVQFHPPAKEYVNNVEHVLHLWRWSGGEFPMPPSILVGVKEIGVFKNEADARRAEQILKRGRAMTDIVERLRQAAQNDAFLNARQLKRDAADEIERLRKENVVLKAADYEALQGDKSPLLAAAYVAAAYEQVERLRTLSGDEVMRELIESQRAEIERLRTALARFSYSEHVANVEAEIERLRAALQRIADDAIVERLPRDIARAALESSK